ncbi:transporter substrate-binding domain-containing protein [Herbaspirillum sp. YR522]|uniref:transporter substrate-binding domain-containing protein n=1 Tax=Herbaspirillum sp. YR522 TaxID=1144342 RepID=UPI000311B721|nr:transporter substrate-binding domain-containing protein [Herbaspirillum sp. YR522]
MPATPDILSALTPTGKLRASINLGNPILAGRDGRGQVVGVSVDLAAALAERLGVGLELVVFEAAGKSVEAVAAEQADFGFFAIDPLRGQQIAFTAPYVLIEGYYMVRQSSPLATSDQVDRAGTRVMVGQGSAYDLYLTRHLAQATMVRVASSPSVAAHFLASDVEVAAGVKQVLEHDIATLGGLRLLDQRFMVIQQAMGVPKSRGVQAAAYLAAFVEDMKASGRVAEALRRHRIEGAQVAPAA